MSAVTFDLLVIGAGPAGSAAALAALAADPSARVALVDRAAFPRDKVCGDGLTPTSVSVLAELGAGDVLDACDPVRRLITVGPGGGRLVAQLPTAAYVVPRQVLDARLVSRARARGAELIHARVADLVADGDRVVVVDGRWSARCVLAADGANSVVRRSLGLPRHPASHIGVALRGYARVPAGTGRMDIRFVPGRLWPAYGWLFTGDDGHANVGVGTFNTTARPTRRELVALLRDLFPDVEPDPGSVAGARLPLSSARPLLGAGRVLLAGDAAGLVDPLTGEGVHTALMSGMLAGRAAMERPAEPATAYRRAVRRRMGRRLRHVRLAAREQHRRPELLDALIAAAARDGTAARAMAGLALGEDDTRTWLTVATATLRQRLRDQLPARGHG